MNTFTTALDLEPLDNRNNWVLVNSFTYALGSEDGVDVINVPAGFVTNFGTIPRIFRNMIRPLGRYGKAAILHDYLYRIGVIINNRNYTRKEADLIFLEAMEVLKVPKWKRKSIYFAVRMFGGRSYLIK
jgi:signal peptidase I